MPVYTFLCECGNEFEKLSQKATEFDQKENCPKCGKPAPKIFSKVAPFVWGKSGGWN